MYVGDPLCQPSTFKFLLSTSYFLPFTFYILHPTSYFLPSTSYILHPPITSLYIQLFELNIRHFSKMII